MPQTVEIPGEGIAEFPDSMTPDEIKGVIDRKHFSQTPSLPTQVITPEEQFAPSSPREIAAGQAASVTGPIRNAVEAAKETAVGFIPKTLGEVLGFATPAVGAVQDVGRGYGMLKNVLFGKPISEATATNFPETQIIPQAEQTPPFSKERFAAGFNVLSQMGMGAAIGKGLGGPQVTQTPISDTAVGIPKPKEVIQNAEQISEPAPVHGDVLNAPRPEEVIRKVPANVGGKGVQTRGQGEIVQAQKEVTPIPEGMINAVKTPEGKIVGHGVEHGDVISGLSEQYDPSELTSGWVLKRPTKAETDATFIGTDDVQKTKGDFEAAFKNKGALQQTPQEVAPAVPQPEQIVSSAWKLPNGEVVSSGPLHGESPTPNAEAGFLTTKGRYLNREDAGELATGLRQELRGEDFFQETDVVPSLAEHPIAKGGIVESPTAAAPLPKEEAPPAAAAPEPQSITSIKNAQVDTERSTRGLPPVVEPARKAFGEVWDQATKKIDDNPTYPDQLIEELKSKPRALNDVEDAALLHRQVDLQNQYQKSADALFKARESGDEIGAIEHDARVNALSDQLLELYDVGKKAGTETGRGLAARKLLAAEDFSLANMITQKRASNKGLPLTPEQTESVNTAAKRISAAQTAYDAYETSPKAEAYKRRLKTLTQQYRTRTAEGDFVPRKSQKILLDKEGEALKSNLERAKKDWLRALQKDRAANRTPSQKFWDRFVGVERAMKLSSDVVLAKLSAAALVREAGLTPAEEIVGAGIGKILPGLAKRAPREGGFSLSAEIKAKSEMFTSGMKDAWRNLKMQQTDLDTLYSSRKPPPPSEFYDYLGYLHGALKAPVKRAEFARSLTKRMQWAVKNGQDLNNVNTMRELSEEAYVDANRSIFMQDNIVSSTFTGALRMAEMSKKAPNLGPAVARIGRFLVPIVKIPTNIVGEVATGIHGVGVGGSRAAVAYLKGIDSLPPAQADSIMRQLKKGAIGNALILTGYYTANNIGGFYHDQDKRTPEDVQPGRYRIGNVDLPASAGHSTGAMLLNIGATVKRVQDERVRKSESTTKGLGDGIRAAGAGLAHEIPFVPAVTGITDALGSPHGFEKYVNGMIQSTTVPALSSHIAKILDTPGSLPSNILQEPVKRKPTTPVEAIKMGIPGLRQTVPEKGEKKGMVYR